MSKMLLTAFALVVIEGILRFDSAIWRKHSPPDEMSDGQCASRLELHGRGVLLLYLVISEPQ